MNRGLTVSCRNETFCQEEGAEVRTKKDGGMWEICKWAL